MSLESTQEDLDAYNKKIASQDNSEVCFKTDKDGKELDPEKDEENQCDPSWQERVEKWSYKNERIDQVLLEHSLMRCGRLILHPL